MQALSQWAALELLADTNDSAFAALLDVPVTWWVDAHGVAHGKPEHAADAQGNIPDPVTGTLRDLCSANRHAKSCMSVARAGGDRAVAAATLAQQLTEGLHGYEHLTDLVDADPVAAVLHSAHLLSRLPQTDDPALQQVVARVASPAEQARERALARARSETARAALLDTAVAAAAFTHPDSPVVQLRALLDKEAGAWVVMTTLEHTPIDAHWVHGVQTAIHAFTPKGLSVLDALETDALRAAVDASTDGSDMRARIEAAWRDRLLALAAQAPQWVVDHAERVASEREALSVVVTDPGMWAMRKAAVQLAWGRDEHAGVVVVPRPVAQWLTAVSSVFTGASLSRPLTLHEEQTLTTLVRDAGWRPDDLSSLVDTAIALTA